MRCLALVRGCWFGLLLVFMHKVELSYLWALSRCLATGKSLLVEDAFGF